MIDSHIHIDSEVYQDGGGVGELLAQACTAGVTRVVAPSLHFESHRALLALSQAHPTIYPAAGIHPHEVNPQRCQDLSGRLARVLQETNVPIVGETGLEAHYDFTPMELQLQSLRSHIEVAKAHGVPLILHCREAEELLLQELSGQKLPRAGVVHCFTGNWEWAQKFLDLGFYIGLTGIVTFKKSVDVQEVAAKVPSDRLLVETDGPYLAPTPHRGKTNKPEYIPLIINKIAQLRGESAERVAEFTERNTERLFQLPC